MRSGHGAGDDSKDGPSLSRTPVFISGGQRDPIVPRANTERLAGLLREANADVTLAWQPAGHKLTNGDVAQASEWLGRVDAGLPAHIT